MKQTSRCGFASYNCPSFAFSFCFIKWSILCVLILLHKMIHPLRLFSFCFIKWSILCVFVLLQNLLNTLLFVWCCFEDQTRSMEKVMTQRKTAKHGAFCQAHRHIKGWTILWSKLSVMVLFHWMAHPLLFILLNKRSILCFSFCFSNMVHPLFSALLHKLLHTLSYYVVWYCFENQHITHGRPSNVWNILRSKPKQQRMDHFMKQVSCHAFAS